MNIRLRIKKISKAIIEYIRNEKSPKNQVSITSKNFWTEKDHYNIFVPNTITLRDYEVDSYASGFKLIGLIGMG
ncbi:MAG: hypothetical protein ACI8YQ_002635 [Polaribacter sp.]|jgi:hypothetical protein